MIWSSGGQVRNACAVVAGCWMAFFLPLAAAKSADNREPAVATAWTAEQSARVRMVAGGVASSGAGKRIFAGLEIELDDGWKTYWRNPGTSGVPPRIDLDGSENLASGELMFPAPVRFRDRDGDTIGYKKHVVLPVQLTPKDPTKPIVLKVATEFGICREVCIPVQPMLNLVVPADALSRDGGARLHEAVARVPRPNARDDGAPRLVSVAASLSGDKPKLVIDATFPGGVDAGDVFLEAPDGLWIPLPQPATSANGGNAKRFIVDLTDGADLAELKGQKIRMTLVGARGQSETSFDLVEAR